MSHEITPEMEALLQLAAIVRSTPDANPAATQQLKALTGDWTERECPQTAHYPEVKRSMKALLGRAMEQFPKRVTVPEANQLVKQAMGAADEERVMYAGHEVLRFWNELSQVSELLGLRLLAIKYDVQLSN